MSEPKGESFREGVRRPVVAGLFYPSDADECRRVAAQLVRRQSAGTATETVDEIAGIWIGGIVPHAGWICSGAVAGQTIGAILKSRAGQGLVDVVVVFGAVHTPLPIENAALDSHARWLVPGGESGVPELLERKLIESNGQFRIDDRFHVQEHAVEVELPLIQQAWPNAALLPVEVPLIDDAAEIGRRTAREIAAANLRPVFLASSDLTHYGDHYGFAPAGLGLSGLQWAKENDRRLLDLVGAMRIEAVVPEVRGRYNACGGGAIAAMMAACREFGASAGHVLRQTSSYETLADVAPQSPDNAVGYAAVVVG